MYWIFSLLEECYERSIQYLCIKKFKMRFAWQKGSDRQKASSEELSTYSFVMHEILITAKAHSSNFVKICTFLTASSAQGPRSNFYSTFTKVVLQLLDHRPILIPMRIKGRKRPHYETLDKQWFLWWIVLVKASVLFQWVRKGQNFLEESSKIFWNTKT